MFKSGNFLLSNIACLCLLIQSCVPKLPEYKNIPKDKIETPNSFPSYGQESEKEEVIKKHWQLFFKDEQLVTLIETALKNNQNLNILDQEINIANNQVMARQGQYLPKVGIAAGYESEKTNKFTSSGADDAAAGLPDKLHNRQLLLNTSWEVDIWKKLRNFAKSSYLEYLASIEGRNFVVTQLVAEVASDYYELMSLDNQLEIIEQYTKTLQEAQQVVKWQQVAGRNTSLPVKRFDAEVLKNQSRKYKIQQQIVITENHLNTLLGRLPQHIERDSKKFQKIAIQDFATDIPSALLDNRPDVKQASLKLEAAKLDVKAVKTEFYPSLNIDANVGYRSFNSHHFIDPASVFYDIAGNLTAPLLNRNAIKADYFSSNNRQIKAIYNYEQTFINAFAEVSNQLASVENLKQIYAFKLKQTEALSESFDISNILFKAARVDYLESLLTRRDYLESQIELTEVKQQQLTSYVNLYKALGGGWRSEELKSVN
ncbi:MAG: TolC family protein [Proteobacteria bacterium]|nr:TolC family protein [Pseudomonadota bacterium]